ncbi:Hypothetical protein A7982_09575 [Minicystis rosea]|nr:Hypothetical protein A7982_09575 [Minicystis rosea]
MRNGRTTEMKSGRHAGETGPEDGNGGLGRARGHAGRRLASTAGRVEADRRLFDGRMLNPGEPNHQPTRPAVTPATHVSVFGPSLAATALHELTRSDHA